MNTLYKHFTITERESLLKMQATGMRIRQMARELGRAPSSVSRELKRNASGGDYSPSAADAAYRKRRAECVRKKRLNEPGLRGYVYDRLLDFWSPEQIAGRLELETGRRQISYASIYRAIYAGELDIPKACLRRKRRSASPHSSETRGRIHDYRHIQERPTAANNASQYGHWEGDTVRGALGKGAVATFVDRRSGFLVARLMPDRKAQTLTEAMVHAFDGYPARLKRTFTVDHGNEFFSFADIESRLMTKVFFADPYAPWQRGLNENTNGLLRQYFPKKCDFLAIPQSDFDAAIFALNSRPRKKLGFRSPNELFLKLLHFA